MRNVQAVEAGRASWGGVRSKLGLREEQSSPEVVWVDLEAQGWWQQRPALEVCPWPLGCPSLSLQCQGHLSLTTFRPPAGPTPGRSWHPHRVMSPPAGHQALGRSLLLADESSRPAAPYPPSQSHAGMEGTLDPHRFGFQPWLCHFLSCVASSVSATLTLSVFI